MPDYAIYRLPRIAFLTMILLCMLCTACQSRALDPPRPSDEAAVTAQVYFTTPAYPDTTASHQGTVDEHLITAIEEAESSIDLAMYDFDLANVAAALVEASRRGVAVRLVTETDYVEEVGPVRLARAGIPVVTDDLEPFMHDKFIVIDGRQVWTGSWNIKESETYRNNNNVVVIDSTKLAANYTTEFNEMFEDGLFGSTSPREVPYPRIEEPGITIETIFESEGNARQRIMQLIRDAESSVYFMAFVLTDDGIAEALVDRHRAGLDVAGVVEARNTDATGTDFAALRKAGVDILEDGNPYIMHHKVIIVDEAIVITGSYNFTSSAANYNDENVLIIHSEAIAADYAEEFQRVYQQAE